MTDFIPTFRDRLEVLERERLKIHRDLKAHSFLAILVFSLGCCLAAAGLLGHSLFVGFLAIVFIFVGFVLRQIGEHVDDAYQNLFRERITRDWFHQRSVESGAAAYLATAPRANEISVALKNEIEESGWQVTDQSPSRTEIEERVFFEPDAPETGMLVLRQRPIFPWGRDRRAVSWYRHVPRERLAASSQNQLRDLRQLVLSVMGAKAKVKASATTTGTRVGVQLSARPFAAPVISSALDPASYALWDEDFKRLGTPLIARALLAY